MLSSYAADNAELSQTLIDLTESVAEATRERTEIASHVAQLEELRISVDEVLGAGENELIGAGSIGRDFGELLRELTLDPTKDYQPLGPAPGPPPKKPPTAPAAGVKAGRRPPAGPRP